MIKVGFRQIRSWFSTSKTTYLDHASTTPVSMKVLIVMIKTMLSYYGNSNSVHSIGVASNNLLKNHLECIEKLLNAAKNSIIITSGATESNNLAIGGVIKHWKTNNDIIPEIIISAIEHPSILAFAKQANSYGVKVKKVSVGLDGKINLNQLETLLNRNTILISIMHVNSEIGVIQDLPEIIKVIQKFKRKHYDDRHALYPIFHTDASQSVRSHKFSLKRNHIDLLTFNAHKFYGPKGVGGLYINPKIKSLIDPIFASDYETLKSRPGTVSVSLVAGMSTALKLTYKYQNRENERLRKLQVWLGQELINRQATLNGPALNSIDRIPGNLHVTFNNINHDYLQFQLDAKGFAVATKSACLESGGEGSSVLHSVYGNTKEGLRISLGVNTTKHDLKKFLQALDQSLEMQARF